MPLTCFTCGDNGHGAWDCPNIPYLGQATARPFTRTDPDPPTTEYLQARADLNMPSSGPQILSVACPWCKAAPWRRCTNVGSNRDTDPHTARQEAAGLGRPRPSRRLLDLARAQVAESRTSRATI
jgi:hypothetical protein